MRDKSQVVLPLDLGICIPKGDFVFKVAEICKELDYTELFNTYVRKWRKVNPVTLFEILVFGYMEHLYSGRDIEKACRTDIRFMWLLNGEPAPSHATISRFQDERLTEAIEGLFYQFVEKLYELGEVKFKNLFVDVTKIEACFIKPTNYEISKKRTYKTNPYSVENMAYNEAKDEYTCPDGRKLKFKRETKKATENGYVVSTRYYSNDKCGRCPHRDKCHSSKNGYRTVRVNQVLNEYRPKVLEALTSERDALLRMNRSIQVEGVFGVLKEDYGFRRFLTRGKKNVETQFFLLAFALNIQKLCNRQKKGRIGLDLFPLNAS